MKTPHLIVIALMFSIPAFCTNPVLNNSAQAETEEIAETISEEIKKVINNVFDGKEEKLFYNLNEKIKVIIINDSFQKVRVDYVDKIEDIYTQSTLLPVINRSEFISRIDNVSYFMLRK